MLPWEKLITDARALHIDRLRGPAYDWIHKHLPELSTWYAAQDGKRRVDNDRFTWDQQWPNWQKNFKALKWLVKARALPPQPRLPQHRIPLWVQHIVESYLRQTRNVLVSDWITEARVALQLSGGYNAAGRFDTLGEFWELVFVSFFRPEDVPVSYCSDCGKTLAVTPKLKKTSRMRFCPACRVKKWRHEHPQEARELWRRSKAGPA